MKQKTNSKIKSQSERFIEAAKAAQTDDDKERFEKQLGRIAKAKRPPHAPKKAKTVSGLVAFALALLMVSAHANAEDQAPMRGAATSSCGTWTREHGGQFNPMTSALDQWVLGYITAMEQFGPIPHNIVRTDNAGLLGWISNYCAAHPIDSVNAAAIALSGLLESGPAMTSGK